ncbi:MULTISPECIES: LytR C-terminal domain-containing protein [Actinomyces]|uniref:LytR C-terminal domain-containing protein n=1 Tax=Actinomyces respiraculi TaxID=2744574 RepID=A0A7T0LLG1_9ACTO|nr:MULTISPECIES: LytR C-terminal domain-containing protein [Actinomyces]QPL05621.1 LytR C-terminal domain-containing protein [Actinomyces respiraculi]
MSQYTYPEDEFDVQSDDGPVPVGVHRAPVPTWRGWLPLLVVIVVVPLLAWGAVALLGSRSSPPSAATGSAETEAARQTATSEESEPAADETEAPAETQAPAAPAPAATTEPPASADLTTGVTVHNGTSTNGLAARTSDRLSNAGYTAVTVSPGSYEQEEPSETTVFYSAPEHAATARAVAEALGITRVVEDSTMAVSNPIVLVLRPDFVG